MPDAEQRLGVAELCAGKWPKDPNGRSIAAELVDLGYAELVEVKKPHYLRLTALGRRLHSTAGAE